MLDERLRALAHEARRQILEACRERAQPAGALVTLVGLAPASVSEHLKMRKTGLLVLDRRGRFRYDRTDTEAVDAVARELVRLSRAA